jgi:hypothetical protein
MYPNRPRRCLEIRHVRDASDDIQTQYDLVISVWRTSGPSNSTNRAFSDGKADALEYCRTLYVMWEFVFNQSPNRHQEITSVEDLDQTEGPYPCWTPLLLGYTTSNQPIFDGQGREDTSTRTSTSTITKGFADRLSSRTLLVRRNTGVEEIRCQKLYAAISARSQSQGCSRETGRWSKQRI